MDKTKHASIKDILAKPQLNTETVIKGWVRTKRGNKNIKFIAINDGSTIHNIQVIADADKFDEDVIRNITTGACIAVTGNLVESMGKGQTVEIQAHNIHVYGTADPDKYPLQKKGHTLEFLRDIAHLRFRTNTFGAVMRIRHALSFAIHKYFNDNGFFYFHTPIITGSDCEGAGEMFRVTTLDMANPPLNKDGSINYKDDFFGKQTNLTVSGQLEGEMGAMALSKIYTFGPTFRAENSNTPRHISEFWMIEPEMAFFDIHDDMDLAENFLKSLIRYILEHCSDDLQFLEKMYDNDLISRLHFTIENDFERVPYTKAIKILEQSGQKFEYPVSWGIDLQTEHERYLVEKHFKKPVMVSDYPAKIKAFYMKLNEDGKTVRALDVLFPKIGEIIGGSEREENYDVLLKKIKDNNMPEKDLWWYLDTRKFGTAPHSGFGLGFERMMMFITGMSNIRDVIPFPRTPKNAEF